MNWWPLASGNRTTCYLQLLRSDPLRLNIGGSPRGQLPLDLSAVYAGLAQKAVAGEVQQMQILLYSQRYGPVWSGNVRRRDLDAAVITVRRAVVMRRHDPRFPKQSRSN